MTTSIRPAASLDVMRELLDAEHEEQATVVWEWPQPLTAEQWHDVEECIRDCQLHADSHFQLTNEHRVTVTAIVRNPKGVKPDVVCDCGAVLVRNGITVVEHWIGEKCDACMALAIDNSRST